MRLRSILISASLLALLGCGGGANSPAGAPGAGQLNAPSSGAPGSAALDLSAQREGASYRVNLYAQGASDLYQIAGTLSFDGGRYRVLTVEAGGGLGSPEEAVFLGTESAPGQVDFAYTKRAYGAGYSGDLWLLSVIVEPQAGDFSLGDFSLDQQPGKLLLRDSKKQALSVSLTRGGVK